jgi:hypothetical protein
MKSLLVGLVLLVAVTAFAQSLPVVRMTTDQRVTLTLADATTPAPMWSLVDPAVSIATGQSPFRVAYIVTLAPDGYTCLVTPKGKTSISDGLGTWEVQARVAGRVVGRATLIIAADGATGITAAVGSSIVASGLTR